MKEDEVRKIMDGLIVVYDSSVLYPAPLRDFLMHLAIIDQITLPDPNDRHVLAAVIRSIVFLNNLNTNPFLSKPMKESH